MTVTRARFLDLSRGLLWISPWVIGFGAFLLAPILMSMYYSFTDYSLLDVPVVIGVDNYHELAGDALFWVALRNTIFFAMMMVVGSTILSVGLAVLLENPLRGGGFVRAIVFLPTLVPVVSVCVTWRWMFNPEYGLINTSLSAIGVQGPNWLGEKALALPSMALMSLWVIGSPMLICAAALKDVPRSLYEAATLDGASSLGRFRHVTLPMISPAIMFNLLMSVIWALQVIAPPMIMTRGGPDNATLTYSMYVYKVAFEFGRMGYASSLAWIQVLLTLALACVVLAAGRGRVYYRAA